ncbi:hypothetical protein B296_00038583, partial [Ensete ventricosum]
RGDPVPPAAQEEVPRHGIRQEERPAQERLLPPARSRGPLRPGAQEGGLRLTTGGAKHSNAAAAAAAEGNNEEDWSTVFSRSVAFSSLGSSSDRPSEGAAGEVLHHAPLRHHAHLLERLPVTAHAHVLFVLGDGLHCRRRRKT